MIIVGFENLISVISYSSQKKKKLFHRQKDTHSVNCTKRMNYNQEFNTLRLLQFFYSWNSCITYPPGIGVTDNEGMAPPVYLDKTETSAKSHWTIKSQDPVPRATVTHAEVETKGFSFSSANSLLFSLKFDRNRFLSMTQIIPMENMTKLLDDEVHMGFREVKAIRSTSFKKNPTVNPQSTSSLKEKVMQTLKSEVVMGVMQKVS